MIFTSCNLRALDLLIKDDHKRLVGRVVIVQEYFDVRSSRSTKGEAAPWLAVLVGTELEKKTRVAMLRKTWLCQSNAKKDKKQ